MWTSTRVPPMELYSSGALGSSKSKIPAILLYIYFSFGKLKFMEDFK